MQNTGKQSKVPVYGEDLFGNKIVIGYKIGEDLTSGKSANQTDNKKIWFKFLSAVKNDKKSPSSRYSLLVKYGNLYKERNGIFPATTYSARLSIVDLLSHIRRYENTPYFDERLVERILSLSFTGAFTTFYPNSYNVWKRYYKPYDVEDEIEWLDNFCPSVEMMPHFQPTDKSFDVDAFVRDYNEYVYDNPKGLKRKDLIEQVRRLIPEYTLGILAWSREYAEMFPNPLLLFLRERIWGFSTPVKDKPFSEPLVVYRSVLDELHEDSDIFSNKEIVDIVTNHMKDSARICRDRLNGCYNSFDTPLISKERFDEINKTYGEDTTGTDAYEEYCGAMASANVSKYSSDESIAVVETFRVARSKKNLYSSPLVSVVDVPLVVFKDGDSRVLELEGNDNERVLKEILWLSTLDSDVLGSWMSDLEQLHRTETDKYRYMQIVLNSRFDLF